jgi:hypothetical protein
MTNDLGTRSDRSRFTIDQPFIYIESPASGAYLNTPTIAIIGEYGQVDAETMEVLYDETDITGEISINGGDINGELTGVGEGNHELVFTAQTTADLKDTVEVRVPFYVEILPPHFDLSLSSYIIMAGESVDVIYTFYNETGSTSPIRYRWISRPQWFAYSIVGDNDHLR